MPRQDEKGGEGGRDWASGYTVLSLYYHCYSLNNGWYSTLQQEKWYE